MRNRLIALGALGLLAALLVVLVTVGRPAPAAIPEPAPAKAPAEAAVPAPAEAPLPVIAAPGAGEAAVAAPGTTDIAVAIAMAPAADPQRDAAAQPAPAEPTVQSQLPFERLPAIELLAAEYRTRMVDDIVRLNLNMDPGNGPYVADLTGDDQLDFFDFFEFQNLLALGDPAADFTGDGAIDHLDAIAFQRELAAATREPAPSVTALRLQVVIDDAQSQLLPPARVSAGQIRLLLHATTEAGRQP